MILPRPSVRLVALLALCAAALGARVRPARADVKIEARVVDGEVTATDAKPAPAIEITVIGGSALEVGSYTLRQADKNTPAIKASKVTPYVEGPDPVGIVVLIEGDGYYLGASQMADGIAGALASLAAAGPPGSQGVVLTYTDAVEVAQAAGPLADLATVKLVAKPTTGPTAVRNLAAGLKGALAELDKLTTKRKALVVIGDAVDGAGAGTASSTIRELGKQLAERNVTAAAFVYQIKAPEFGQPGTPMKLDPVTKVQVPDEDAEVVLLKEYRQVLKQATEDAKFLTADHVTVVSGKTGFAGAADSFGTELADRFYVRFPGHDAKAKAGLTWDGKPHLLTLRVEGNDLASVEATLAPTWGAPGGGSSTWIFIVIPLALIAVGAVIFKVTRKPTTGVATPAMAPGGPGVPGPGGPGAPAPGGPAAPPAPSKPQKTQFFNVGGDDVFPVVGWLVFLNGPQKFKTHKLPSGGVMKIGTGKESDIVIDDGYMSTNHAFVMTTPDGFLLEDSNSTNGTFLNNVRVRKQELNDNDVVMVGRTQLKFKSTI